jgi:hypothetical protein
MKKYFVSYEQSLDLKEIGYVDYSWFGSECSLYKPNGEHTFYMNGIGDETYISAPLKSQVFEWFRKEHKLRANVMDFIDDITGIEWDYEIATIGTDLDESGNYIPLVDYSIDDEMRKFKTYEEAESACIDKLIELVKKK